jgi:hypothetical protein
MNWHYFRIGHGKGEWDGASVVVKRALRAKQPHNPQRKLQDAADVEFFIECMSSQAPNTYQGVHGFFINHHF